MKTESSETVATINERQPVTINPELDKYQGKILFPEKLALAEKQIKGLDIDKIRNYRGQ